MARDTHVVRFKVVSIRCPSMPEAQQYTIYYRRGDTKRSTPCYAAHNGEVDFSSMPEGAAMVHFKPGGGGRRYAPKYIQFRVEEYTRGAPRRTVGECEADCSVPLQRGSGSSRQIVEYVFRMYGAAAHIRVAFLVYPMHAPPLSFDGMVAPSTAKEDDQEIPRGELKHMQRGEAMSLLISLETMLERRRADESKGEPRALSKIERRLKELEDRRRSLTGSEGLSTTVVASRCQDCVHAQFVALARTYRNNYIGETAAYLRQMALTSGAGLTGGDEAMDDDTAREQLTRVTSRIGELEQQLRKLEEEQMALGRIQHKTDVTQELMANLQKVETINVQLQMIKSQKTALEAAAQSRSTASANSPLARETKEMGERVKTLTGEQSQLQAKIQHMTAIAASHVLSWARSKNPPEADTTTATKGAGKKGDIDDLFSNDEGTAQAYGDAQRKQIMSALKGLGASAPPPTNRSMSSTSSSSGHRTPRDMFSGAEGLPSMGDFGAAKPKPAKAEKHQDPTKPSDLGMNMFTASPPKPKAAEPTGLPSMNDFMASSNNRGSNAASSPSPFGGGGAATFEFGSPSPFGGGGGFGGFGGAAPASAATTDATPLFTLEPESTASTGFGAPQQVQPPSSQPAAGGYNKKDDPFYDEMDDFTVPPEEDNSAKPMFEFSGGDGGFNFGAAAETPSPAPAAPSGFAAAPAPRPTFDFGPSTDGAGAADEAPGFSFTTGTPSFDFGGGGDTGSTGTGTGSANPFGAMPSYTFS